MKSLTRSGFKFLTILLSLLTFACSKNDDDFNDKENGSSKNAVAGLSFSWDFTNDYPYKRTYDLAFVNNKTFEFSATAHGTTGEQFGSLVGDYTLADDQVIFNYGGRGFLVTSSYVRPVSGILVRDENNKITGMEILLRFENRDGKVSTSELSFHISDYKPTYKEPDNDLKKIKEKDLQGTVWEMSGLRVYRKSLILCKDHTTFGLGESWSFDEKNQTLTIIDGGNTSCFTIFSGDRDEFECEKDDETYKWTRVDLNDNSYYLANFIDGSYIDEKGRTLQLPSLEGTAAPAMPNSSKSRIYKSQSFQIDSFNGLSGVYVIYIEGQEWDRTKYIDNGWHFKGGNIIISDPLKSHKEFRLTLDGKINGEFRLIQE